MKNIFTFAALVCALSASFATAASLSVVGSGPVYSLYLDGGADNGAFDSIDVQIAAGSGSSFMNQDSGFNGFFPRAAGEEFSFINPLLGAATAQGGEGWSVLGATNTPDLMAFGGGPLGATISTAAKPAPGLFLANIMTQGSGLATVQVISAGNILSTLTADVGGVIPEPATMALAGMGLIGFIAIRRRAA